MIKQDKLIDNLESIIKQQGEEIVDLAAERDHHIKRISLYWMPKANAVEGLRSRNELLEYDNKRQHYNISMIRDERDSREKELMGLEKIKEAALNLFFGEHSPDQFSGNDIAALRTSLLQLD